MGYLCYHHNDMDGKGAGNEVYEFLTNSGIHCTPSMFIQRGYDEPFSEQDYANKTVYIVDLSFTEESIKKLYTICEGASSVTWIDHHKSSIMCIEDDDIRKKLASYGNLTYFVNNGACGALLTHLWLTDEIDTQYKNEQSLDFQFEYVAGKLRITDPEAGSKDIVIPQRLRLIDLWDRWVYGEYMKPVYFNYGCGLHNSSLFAYKDKDATEKTYNDGFWRALKSHTYITKLLDEGYIAKQYSDSQSARNLAARGYECDILGHKALVLNMEGSSMVFGNKIKDYDVVCLWQYDGKLGKYKYSLYSEGKVDCAELATKLDPNGGGHEGAAGFSSDKLIFKKS